MTTSVRNARSAIAVLERTITAFRKHHGPPPIARIEWHLAILLDSAKKCLEGLVKELRLYQSAKGVGRAYWIEQPDGTQEYVSGQQLQTLVLSRPSQDEDLVIHGKPAALEDIREALTVAGYQTLGPAQLDDILQPDADPEDVPHRQIITTLASKKRTPP
ncbi:hypothetical protein [uncultured Roseibium sp.]|uniref:hypothetical protein n=1 Tax=uncultured Roseibium sp. TaxID=1936171 RepID=UPI00262EBCAA|nr:hypothetical protein [uncultured Roseibium sp.]